MLIRFLLAFALAFGCAASCRAAPGALDLPGQFSAAAIGQDLRLNGLPLDVQVIATSAAPRLACSLIARLWGRTRGVALLGCRQSGEWLVVSACVGSEELTVQLQAAATGSRGYLSTIDLRGHPAAAPVPRVPMPVGAQVRNVLQSSGPEGEVAEFTIEMPSSPLMAWQRLTASARRFGWEASAPPQSWASGGTFELRRRNELERGVLIGDFRSSGLFLVESTVEPRRR